MHIQLEVTTICNYDCFYCAGRDMEQRHMEMSLFEKIIKDIPADKVHRVSLQGEGEPTLHPEFWRMVETVSDLGHIPYTISNGTRLKPELIKKYFPSVFGISIDTINAEEAEKIKRYNLKKVLKNLDKLLECYDPMKIVIHTVDYGQDIQLLSEYLRERKIYNHVIQPLQIKDDYSYRYQDKVEVPQEKCTYQCGFIDEPVLRYYNIDGVEMPCCYIKNVSVYTSIENIKTQLDNKVIPDACAGCRELYDKEDLTKVFKVQ